MSFALREKNDNMVQEILTQEVTEPSQSPWASLIILVGKKDDVMHFVVTIARVAMCDVFPPGSFHCHVWLIHVRS